MGVQPLNAGAENILVKSEEEISLHAGCRPQERPIEEYLKFGVVNIDKTSGPTSHQFTSWVSRAVGVKKAGHSGTLDPKVTGVLPVCFENATKIVQFLLLAPKEYVCLMKLHGEVTNNDLKKTFSEYQTNIYQRPPLKSAVKRELRVRHIYEIKFMEKKGPYVLFSIRSEAGTYIRKICHDFGLTLGVSAHMQQLRRIKSGPYDESTIVTLHDLADAAAYWKEDGDEKPLRKAVQPVETAVSHLKKIWVSDGAVDSLCHGATLKVPGVLRLSDGITKGEYVGLMTQKDELVAVAEARMTSKEIMDAQRGECAVLERVIMNTDVYPKRW
ncbi:putative tRNA pseudouridine synthase B [uncultured archaeon]|nr:putative tRNA pseudouridine synthase B [uncultured archaeon]